MALGAVLGAMAGPLLGGFVQNRQNRQARRQWEADRAHNEAREDMLRAEARAETARLDQRLADLRKEAPTARGVDYQKLVDDAQSAGFNPLTVLMAGGGSGYGREFSPEYLAAAGAASQPFHGVGFSGGGYQADFQPNLTSGSFIAEAISRGADTYFNIQSQNRDIEAQKAENERQRQHEIRMAGQRQPVQSNFGYDLQQVQPFMEPRNISGPSLSAFNGRPQARPTPQSTTRVPVYNPFGNMVLLQPDVALRLGVSPFGNLMAGDWAELVGELGEVELAAGTGNVRMNQLGVGGLGLGNAQAQSPDVRSGPRSAYLGNNPPVMASPVQPSLPPFAYPPTRWQQPWNH